MEQQLLAQVRGLMILAKAANLRKEARVCFSYLVRANELIKRVEAMRGQCEQRAA
jgi:hypothetical protein